MQKRIFSLLLLLALLFVNFTASAETQVYYIGRQADFMLLELYPNADFCLKSDIIFEERFSMLFKNPESPFRGSLDGKGHMLYFLNIRTDGTVAAFIGYNSGWLRNLSFVEATVACSTENAVAGGLTAFNNGIIEECAFSGRITVNGVLQSNVSLAAVNNGTVKSTDKPSRDDSSATVGSDVTESFTTLVSETGSSVSSGGYVNSVDSKTSSSIIIYESVTAETSNTQETSSVLKNNSSEKRPTDSVTSFNKLSSAKHTSSVKADSSKKVYSDRQTLSQTSAFSDTSSDAENTENGGASIFLLGLCVAAVLFACGFAVYREIKYKTETNKKA